ncbi:MAG: acyltransferase family protein [Bacteroidetes bacterium]|uniref:Acyltransferase family protein n=1 Tax=Candidatus Caccoplasma merdipullorum TaxID=2840718 RepID=A0A9D9E1R5_9BACT|nr:acyltransferase family protein [Candidatus Caccoplasma merdipullorum]
MEKRNLSLDLIKFIAMIGVICLHSQNISSPISHFLYITAVFSIPLFFMSSGYILLGKTGINYKYSAKKIFGILRFVIIVTISYHLLIGIYRDNPLFESTLGTLLQKGPFSAYWYFGAMIIIYALLPLIDYLYREKEKIFFAVTLFLFVIANVVFILNFTSGIHVEQNTIQTFRLWNWLLYFCLGGIIKRYTLKVNWVVVVMFLLINYIFQIYTAPKLCSLYCEFFYPSLPTIIFSAVSFIYLINIRIDNKFIRVVSDLFLPCYTIHGFVITKTGAIFKSLFSFAGIFTPVLFWIFVCVVSISLSWVIMKIPYMNKVFRI